MRVRKIIKTFANHDESRQRVAGKSDLYAQNPSSTIGGHSGGASITYSFFVESSVRLAVFGGQFHA